MYTHIHRHRQTDKWTDGRTHAPKYMYIVSGGIKSIYSLWVQTRNDCSQVVHLTILKRQGMTNLRGISCFELG